MANEKLVSWKIALQCRNHAKHPHIVCPAVQIKMPCPFKALGIEIKCSEVKSNDFMELIKEFDAA